MDLQEVCYHHLACSNANSRCQAHIPFGGGGGRLGSFSIVSGSDTTPRIMNPTVTVNPNGPSLCWSPLQRTTNSALHKSVFSSAPCSTHASASPRVVLDDHDSVGSKVPGVSSKFGTGVGVYGVAVPARRPAAQVVAGDSGSCEDETSAVAAAIRLLESHQLLQQVAPLLISVRLCPCCCAGQTWPVLPDLWSSDPNFYFAQDQVLADMLALFVSRLESSQSRLQAAPASTADCATQARPPFARCWCSSRRSFRSRFHAHQMCHGLAWL
jgi:hypothetical protein